MLETNVLVSSIVMFLSRRQRGQYNLGVRSFTVPLREVLKLIIAILCGMAWVHVYVVWVGQLGGDTRLCSSDEHISSVAIYHKLISVLYLFALSVNRCLAVKLRYI
jgi:hypothetical protein